MNHMHLTSAIDNAKTVTLVDIPWLPYTIHTALHSMRCNGLVLWMVQTQKFGVPLLVKDLGSKGKCKFSFKTSATMMKAGVDVGTNDMLMNYIHADDMAMNGDTPWRGGREKDPRFFIILLEAISVKEDLILDCIASIGDYSI